MKIAFAVDTLNRTSGIVKVVRNIASALAQQENVEISIICTGKEPVPDHYIPENICIYDLNIDCYGRRKKYLWYVGALKKLFSIYKPDVLVVSGMEHVLFYQIASTIIPAAKKYAWEHLHFYAGPKFRLEWLGKRIALRKWNGVLCITKKDYEQYRAYHGSHKGIYQIYNLTDFSCSRNEYNEESARIMSCGYLAHIKGFDMLLDVAQKVFCEKPEWTWDIYGEGELRNSLKQEIYARGLEHHVHMMGYDTKVQERYKEYSFFVLTSRAEGIGMVLIEAQKAGLPVVSFDIPCGPSDVIADGINGYLIPPFDVDKMAERIIELIEDSERRKNFSDASEKYHAEFGKQVILEKWKDMLGLPS